MVKFASEAAWVCVKPVVPLGGYASADKPPSPPDCATVIEFAAPVVVPDSTSLAPSVAVMMLALTPGLFGAELIAAAMPASVLSVESMLIEVDDVPTAIVNVPVPTGVPELATGCEVSEAAVATFCTS